MAAIKKKRKALVEQAHCVAGIDLFPCSAYYLHSQRNKRLLQPLLRTGTTFRHLGWTLWPVTKKGHSQMDEKQMVPIWLSDFLFCDVPSDALEYLSDNRRR